MKIKSYVGGHDINVYTDCTYNPYIRKYVGGRLLTVIPYSGKMLSAKIKQSLCEPVDVNNVVIGTKSPIEFTDIDDIPPESECDYCIVSAIYVAACKTLGKDTSRLLTIGDLVADENGKVIGCINLYRN